MGKRRKVCKVWSGRKRRCVSFGVPVEVYPVSRMSCSERKDLEARLKDELQRIQLLFASPQLSPMEQCEALLHRVMSHKNAHIFNKPVDVVEANAPNYHAIIERPMDLGTIKAKLLSGQYSDPSLFAADVRLTFANAMTYNPQGHLVHTIAQTLTQYFDQGWNPIHNNLPTSNIQTQTATSDSPTNKTKPADRVMTRGEKQKLTAELEEVSAELPDRIIDFLKGNTNNTSTQSNDAELEIDLDSLTDQTLFTLRDLLNDYILHKHQTEQKPEPCEIELHNESGFSNSSVQPCRGNDLADEDVDIGGNDAPMSRFPRLEIKKDGAGQNNKNSSPSSSSSDSGSSSSDSNMGSASHGDSDCAKNKKQVNNEKEICSSGESLSFEQKGSFIGATATGVGDISNNNVQQNSEGNFDSGSYIGCREGGGNTPSERKVSPGKNDREELLRSCYADTILKAQEKSIEKDKKLDLDRLRLQNEEFERKKEGGLNCSSLLDLRNDRAHLVAEARATKVARRNVEAEAKRTRDLEREASRQALPKMEKTVDMNENTQLLEDLDILRSAPEQSLLGVTSPDDDENGLGKFNIQAHSNLLEQLGLYMKDEDAEEEEGEQQHFENDAEEGETD